MHYYYLTQEELWKKYDNLIKKVEQKEELTDMESLDIVFVSKFISKEYAQKVTISLTKAFKNAIIRDKKLRIDVGILLGGMILKHFTDDETIEQLMERINMKKFENEIEALVYDEFGDKIDELEEENNLIKQENETLKEGYEKLSKLDDLSPKAKEIINSLIVIK